MKVAIPEFNGRVSPTMDFCRRLLLVDILSGELSEMTALDFSDMESTRRAWFLKKLGVNTLLCGGISRNLAKDIEENGIKVVPWVSGEIQEVLNAYLMDNLPDPKLTSPGFHGEEDDHRFHGRNELELGGPQPGRKEQGWTLPVNASDGSAEPCVCPKCGCKIAGEKDVPCTKQWCPECGSKMYRR